MKRVILAVVLALSVVSLVGCGGGRLHLRPQVHPQVIEFRLPTGEPDEADRWRC